ncbi:hypothetical protein PBR31_00003 [Xanthomonas phage PBR31]|uniref:Uncharacterized protein n=2 Tax=root TaxID=1 RepID=A0A6H0X5P1_9CAUD|nr:hypothetical protein [Ralstonia pickettii]NYS09341.1 hypothetical protein [Ralstonia pickettii]QIN95314.1 hypothetical protein PBR31_00003 [Xanthomonas phage PBR31]QIW89362.1 hypothetical protein PPDBI_00003 [Xanthomonas phage PPDBI]
MKSKTQYERICTALRIKAMTTMELIAATGSVCPWRRLSEAIQYGYLRANEKLVEGTKRVNGKTLKTWKIVRV